VALAPHAAGKGFRCVINSAELAAVSTGGDHERRKPPVDADPAFPVPAIARGMPIPGVKIFSRNV